MRLRHVMAALLVNPKKLKIKNMGFTGTGKSTFVETASEVLLLIYILFTGRSPP